MKILDYLEKDCIFVNFAAKNKKDFFEKAVSLIVEKYPSYPYKEVLGMYLEREKTMTTGIGQKIAIPHILSERCDSQTLFAFRLSEPINFKSLDKQPVAFVIMILGKKEESNLLYLQMLAGLSRLLKKKVFVEELLKAETVDDIVGVLKKHERR